MPLLLLWQPKVGAGPTPPPETPAPVGHPVYVRGKRKKLRLPRNETRELFENLEATLRALVAGEPFPVPEGASVEAPPEPTRYLEARLTELEPIVESEFLPRLQDLRVALEAFAETRAKARAEQDDEDAFMMGLL